MQNKKLKDKAEKVYALAKEKIISAVKFCRNIKWKELGKHLMNNPFEKILDFLTSWWHAIIIFLAVLIFVYYPIGGLLVSNIDRNTTYEVKNEHPEQSATVEMMSFIVDREVNEKIWTPNLPFFFPSYFLDNMPNFQLGMFEALSDTAVSFSKRIDKKIKVGQRQYLQEAAELLKYPGTVWMFSPDNKLMPAPSANNQYRRARKRLIKFNQRLSEGTDVFYKNPHDLAFFLVKIRRDLGISLKTLQTHVRENSSDWLDFKADNIFYYNQGKLYGYYLLLKAMGADYKDIIVNTGQYQNWTKLLNALEGGVSIDPMIVRNGELSSSTAPNHLSYLSFYTIKAQHLVSKISRNLEYNPQKR
ncbi:MAG: DUF2333 family protein [Alphaproteobacteria bacterium]|nr:DUF2333 family protein [Alphaproteobacteria bacterium]